MYHKQQCWSRKCFSTKGAILLCSYWEQQDCSSLTSISRIASGTMDKGDAKVVSSSSISEISEGNMENAVIVAFFPSPTFLFHHVQSTHHFFSTKKISGQALSWLYF
mmetsp:Transcript_21990/g.32674  ORF Transcript_21990/g.32674 Transcript_21990/m.32674 type:complete len:107 (+) Transcript_21990:1190-1510(+)